MKKVLPISESYRYEHDGDYLMGPAVATGRFFDTLNRIEQKYEEVS